MLTAPTGGRRINHIQSTAGTQSPVRRDTPANTAVIKLFGLWIGADRREDEEDDPEHRFGDGAGRNAAL